jgi:lysophospholipase L1-like esterase
MRLLRAVGIILAISFGLYLVLDLSVGFLFPGLAYRQRQDGASVPAFAQAPYVGDEFFREEAIEPGSWVTISSGDLVAPAEYHGQFFNVDRLPPTDILYRRTINPVADDRPQRTILIVGGSTVYSPETPDDGTIPSYVSQRLNQIDPSYRYVVYNAGISGADTSDDRRRVIYELQHALRPDVVVACDGQSDIIYGIYMGLAGKPSPLAQSRTGLRGFLHDYFPINIARWVWLTLQGRAMALHKNVAPSHLKDPSRLANLIEKTAAIYMDNQLAMAELATKNNAAFLLVLPPSPFSTAYDRPIADINASREATEAQFPGLVAIEPAAQAALAANLRKLQDQSLHGLDLSDALKDKTEAVFVNLSHLNASGNRTLGNMIAEAIAKLPFPATR